MKKVIHVIEYFNVAGAENVVKLLVEKTKSSQIEPEILVLNEIGINGERLQNVGINVHGLCVKKKKIGMLKIIFLISAYFKKRKIDIIHAHNFTPWLFCIFANFFIKKKIVVTLHGMIENKNSIFKKKILRFLIHYTNKIICVSPEIKDELLCFWGNNKNIVEVILNGINLKKFDITVNREQVRREIGVNSDDYLLITVGRFYEIKNFERQIELIANLSKELPKIKLMIAARTVAYAKKIKMLAERLNVQDRILFLGLRDDVPSILKASDLFVMSSFSEGTSLALIEAIAAGLPVVVSNVGGNPNLVQNGVNGFVFDLDKDGDFEQKVLELYNYPEISKKFSDNQRGIVLKFSDKEMIQEYRLIYETLH